MTKSWIISEAEVQAAILEWVENHHGDKVDPTGDCPEEYSIEVLVDADSTVTALLVLAYDEDEVEEDEE